MARTASTRRARPRPLDRLEPFEDDCVLVVIETPKGSPNKLTFEPRYGTFVLKGVLPAGAVLMKGKRFEVKRRAGGKRARALVMAATKRRR